MTAPDPRSASRSGRRVLLVVLVWMIAIGLVALTAAGTSIGPVLWKFASSRGVHLGDVVALCVAVAAAGAVTRRMIFP